MIPKVEKAKSLSKLRDEADEWISKYVRLMASDEYGTIVCISCEDRVWWKEAECCYYKNREHMGTRFYLPNLAAGCHNCNCFEKESHIETWGNKMTYIQLKDLETRSRSLMKWTRGEISDLIIEYKEKVANLRKLKGL